MPHTSSRRKTGARCQSWPGPAAVSYLCERPVYVAELCQFGEHACGGRTGRIGYRAPQVVGSGVGHTTVVCAIGCVDQDGLGVWGVGQMRGTRRWCDRAPETCSKWRRIMSGVAPV